MDPQTIIFGNWQRGIGESPHIGLGLLRNVEIDAFSGALKAGRATETMFHAALSQTFTANASTDVMTISSGSMPITGTAVTVSTTGTLPAGLSASTNYFVIRDSATEFRLATTIANANADTDIDITDAGSGTHTVTTVNPGTVNVIAHDERSSTYFLHDSNGRVWCSTSNGTAQALLLNGNTLTSSAGKGLALLRTSDGSATYLFVFRNASIDVANVHGTSQVENPTWSNAWQSLNTAAGSQNSHEALRGQDNIVYFCDARYVGSIRENSGSVFDPATGGTYTYNNQALDFPNDEIAETLEELGANLLTGGSTFNKIYPWDRTSDSYNLPIIVPERSIKKLRNVGNVVFVLAGTWGNIYRTQGTYAEFVRKIPQYVSNNGDTLASNPVTWGGAAAMNGGLLFGAAVTTTGNSGVYFLFPDGRLAIDNIPFSGSGNATAVFARDTYYVFGHASGASKIDSSRYASFEGVAHSELFQVATKTEKGTLSVLETQLAKPASSGNVRVGYRTDTSSSFTTLATHTADGTATSFKTDDIGLIDLENIQIQAEVDGDVEVLEIRLTP